MHVQLVEMDGFRGLRGSVELGPGLNVIIGPNCSGKTSLLEALAYLATLAHSNLREAHALLALLHAARGSLQHSLSAIVRGDRGVVRGVFTKDKRGSEEVELRIEKRITYEAIGTQINPVVAVSMTVEPRGCRLEYRLGPVSMALRFTDECIEGALNIGIVTPGVYPYNMFDEFVGRAKREESSVWRVLSQGIELDGVRYRVDVAADEWGRLAAYVLEDGEMVPFYSVGRGLQRALVMLAMLEYAELVLIDEVESAMHPELLAQVAERVAHAARRGKQILVTTQSLEAARFLAAAMLGAPREEWRRPETLLARLAESEPVEAFSVIILSRRGGELNTVKLEGAEAIEEVIRGEDVRMLYTLVGAE